MIRLMRRWLRKDDGAAAVEFAMVGLPFITAVLGIVELSLFFASGAILEGAVNDTARLIKTGQVQQSGNPLGVFEGRLCDNVRFVMNCNDLQYEVLRIPGSNFANAEDLTPQFDADGNLVSGGFDPGTASENVLVRVVYRYEFLTPFLGAMITGDATTNRDRLMSTTVFKNEPYVFGS